MRDRSVSVLCLARLRSSESWIFHRISRLAIEFCHRHPAIPRTLTLVSAYAGWGGSLPADVAQQRLQQALVLADLPPGEFVGTLLPTMFSETTARQDVDEFGSSMLAFHPAGFRAMAQASAEDLRDALPDISVPTLLVYGDQDVRAPVAIAEDLQAAISGSTLVVLPGTGHVCNIEAPEAFSGQSATFSTRPARWRPDPYQGSSAAATICCGLGRQACQSVRR